MGQSRRWGAKWTPPHGHPALRLVAPRAEDTRPRRRLAGGRRTYSLPLEALLATHRGLPRA